MTDLSVIYSFPNRIGVPGIGITAWNQVTALVASRVRVTLCCGSLERPIPGLHRVVQTMMPLGVRVPYRLIGRDQAYIWHDYCVARMVDRSSEWVDAVHCWPLGSLKTLQAARRAGIRSVFERPNAHTRFAYEVVEAECRKLGIRLPSDSTHVYNARHLAREEAEYELADCLACPSEFVARTFLERGHGAEQIGRHQYGYNPAEFPPPDPQRQDGGRARPFTAAFVGRCEPRKGLHYALQAWHDSGAARRGQLLICGQYMPRYRSVLSRWLDHPSVQELGFVADVPKLLRRCDVLILPSIEEGSALVTYEARASGCILLVSDATGARCNHGRDALVHKAGDMVTLTEHLRMVLEDRGLRESLRSASIGGLAGLTWSAAAVRLRGLYRGQTAALPLSSIENVLPASVA